jgi:hypothetical protein
VLVRALLGRLTARGEPMPLVQAVAIVLGAAARVHSAHARATRATATPETVLVRFDGVVVVGSAGAGGDIAGDRADLTALTRLLGDLVAGNRLPDALADVVATSFASAAELSRALASAAKAIGLAPSRAELGRWARAQVDPPRRFAHTLPRDSVPALGVDIGRRKPSRPAKRPKRPTDPELANGSGKFDLDEVEMDVELDVDLDDLVDETGVWAGIGAVDAADAVAIGASGPEPSAGRKPLVVVLFALVVLGAFAAYVLLAAR